MSSLPASVLRCLQERKINYQLLTHEGAETLEQLVAAAKVPENRVARAVLLDDSSGFVLVVLPLNRMIDFAALKKQLNRELTPVSAEKVAARFTDCDEQAVPPLGEPYDLLSLVDRSLMRETTLYFEPGLKNTLVKVSVDDFKLLQRRAQIFDFSSEVSGLAKSDSAKGDSGDNIFEKYMPAADVRRRLDQLYSLPPMPQVAMRILQLRDDPDSTVDDLAACVELDPSLAAQVVRYARSPFFGFRGEINSIRDAIHKVLGFNMVTNISVGLASGKSFKNPPDGPLGLNIFWKQATYTAAIAQELARALPKEKRPNLGLAYLSALVHNFGYLLLGHLFKPEFYLLNKLVEANPESPVVDLEQQVLGMGEAQHIINMGHAKLGAWLMYTWKMPDEVVITIAEHHNEDYVGIHSIYANLVLIADRLVKQQGFGDGDSEEMPQIVLDRLGFTEERIHEIFEKVLGGSESLDAIASQLAA